MSTTLGNDDVVTVHQIDDAMFIRDAAWPVAWQVLFQLFGFADAIKRVTAYVADQVVDFFEYGFVGKLPV